MSCLPRKCPRLLEAVEIVVSKGRKMGFDPSPVVTEQVGRATVFFHDWNTKGDDFEHRLDLWALKDESLEFTHTAGRKADDWPWPELLAEAVMEVGMVECAFISRRYLEEHVYS